MRLEGSIAAFSRIELVIVIFVLILFGSVGVAFIGRSQQAKIVQCASNLKQLGVGMALYTKENDSQLPFAYIQYTEWESVAWDGLIYPYVIGGSQISSSSLDKKYDLLRCPADVGDRSRTYAMPQHDMSLANWPPGPENRTGVGLWWSCWQDGGNASLSYVLSHFDAVPAVRLGMIHAPADTLLLTEHASSENSMFSYRGATISGPSEHLDTKTSRMTRYHNGKFNYLMVDGHVELLLPAQKQEIWTIWHNH
jgi:prepilin-type processing-associated H-X9-DG protein